MEIKTIVHREHPLTLLANDGQLVCHGCGGFVFGKTYSCSNCGFHPEKCLVCEETVAIGNGFYICATCWPQSPIFHQSCIDDIQEETRLVCIDDLQEEIRLAYRPHCFLHFVGELDDPRCDFCSREHGRYMYRCEDCDFQIDTRCSLKHIKYHEGQQLVYHFSHRHPLISSTLGDLNCKVCYEKNDGAGYGCAPCQFYIHDSCCDDVLTQEKRNHLHPQHSLELKKYGEEKYWPYSDQGANWCSACGYDLRGWGYGCRECFFKLHIECTFLKPTIKHKGHQHLLILFEKPSYKRKCTACGFKIQGVHYWRCVECDLNFHRQCNIDGGVWHFSHKHILMSRHVQDNEYKFCKGCGEGVRGATYCCEDCMFYLHKSCFDLPRQIYDHQSHDHYLTLRMSYSDNGFIYICDTCYFKMDLHCASEHPSVNVNIYNHKAIDEGQKKIAHFSHRHYLDFVVVAGVNCQLCYKNINGNCYGCSDCKFNIHTSCVELQQEITHPFHPRHSLKLMVTEQPRSCSGCCFDIKGLEYRCNKCYFHLHPECRSSKADIEYKGHHHLLTLVKNTFFEWQCKECDCETTGTSFLRCVKCNLNFHEQCGPSSVLVKSGDLLTRVATKDVGSSCKSGEIYFHKSCFKGPTDIHHPFHRHPLQLTNPFTEKYYTCNSCRKYYCSINYRCEDCDFNLDPDCHPLFPSLKIESIDHEDKLTLFKKMFGKPKCEFCKDSPRDDHLTPLDAFYFRCVKCNLNWHFLCCLLPQTIIHKNHHHSLTLTDNFVDIFDSFEDEEFCCDLCEIRRNAREPIYYCEECSFVVDIECVFSEVMQFLECNHNSDDGRIVGREITRNFKGLTYKHIVESLTEEERMSMEPFMKLVNVIDKDKLVTEWDVFTQNPEEADGGSIMDLCGNDDLSEDDYLFKSMEMKVQEIESIKEELVDVGGYKICKKLSKVLEDLLRDYGDIGASCPFRKCVMTIPLTTLCVFIQEMSITRMIDIEKESISFWWLHLKLIEEAWFKIDFAFNHLKRIYDFCLQRETDERIRTSRFYKIHKEIAEYYETIEEANREIESLKEEAHGLVSSHAPGEAMTRGQNLNEALGFLWKPATLGSLDRIPEI